MGNRANVVFTAGEQISPAIYLHWNGGPESVYAFLAELDRRGVRPDAEYDAARFVQLVGEFFDYSAERDPDHPLDRGLSLGILAGPTAITLEAIGNVRTDPSDNGFYVVDRFTRSARGNRPTVRRFMTDWNGTADVVRELSPEDVAAERRAAMRSPYRREISAWFLELEGRAVKYRSVSDVG